MKTKQKYTTTFLERGSFWFFGIGMLFYYQIVGSYLNTYLLLRGVDLGKVALIFLGIKIWDAVNDPLFAFIFDRVKFKKEKCLPWLRIAAIIMPLASIAVFNMPANWSETGKLIWFAVTYMLWDAAYTVCDVPFFSMTTTMTVQKEIIDMLKDAGLRDKVCVMVGGAPVTQGYADKIGADIYGESASETTRKAKDKL